MPGSLVLDVVTLPERRLSVVLKTTLPAPRQSGPPMNSRLPAFAGVPLVASGLRLVTLRFDGEREIPARYGRPRERVREEQGA